MGGTSTDVCLIEDLGARADDRAAHRRPAEPHAADRDQLRRRGRRLASRGSTPAASCASARAAPGAVPGPACYGRGGDRADRHRRQPRARAALGDGRRRSPARSRSTQARAAGAIDAARGRCSASPTRRDSPTGSCASRSRGWSRAIKEISIAQGHDPRDFALARLRRRGADARGADRRGARDAARDRAAGARQLLGLRLADLRSPPRLCATRLIAHARRRFADVGRGRSTSWRREARARPRRARASRRDASCSPRRSGMRYVGQSWELARARAGRRLDRWTRSRRRSAAAHERRYGHAQRRRRVEIVNFRVAARRPRAEADAAAVARERDARATRGARSAPSTSTASACARPSTSASGCRPAAGSTVRRIVEEMGSTTVVPPGWHGDGRRWGELTLERRSAVSTRRSHHARSRLRRAHRDRARDARDGHPRVVLAGDLGAWTTSPARSSIRRRRWWPSPTIIPAT